MNIGGGETADQMVRMMLSGTEVMVRLGGSALKNLLALTMALAKSNKTISGKVSMTKMLRETRDLRVFPMSPEQYKKFQKLAKRQRILFSAIKDRDGNGQLIDVVMPATELDRANHIFERILYQGPAHQTPDRDERAPEADRPERSQTRDREPPQRAQEGPQERSSDEERPAPPPGQEAPPVGDSRPERRTQLPDDPWEMPPKKGSRSGQDSPDTRTRSSTPRTSGSEMTMSDRPSILGRLKGYREQLDSGKRSVPTREKAKARPKQR